MNKHELKAVLKYEKLLYLNKGRQRNFLDGIAIDNNYIIYKFIKKLRYEEYYYSRSSNSVIFKVLFLLKRRQKNRLGTKLGFFIPMNTCSKGLIIYHYGDIVINNSCKIGKNLKLHGNNCIGNDGKNITSAPIIGNNVDVGYGACIIGNVKVADGVKIGAGAVVVSDILEDNCTVVGCPAKIVRK